jgi:serine protease
MRSILAGVFLLAVLGCGPVPVRTLSTVLQDAKDGRFETFEGQPVVPRRVIVKFRPGTFPDKEWSPSSFLRIAGAKEISRYPEIQVIVLEAPLPVGNFIQRLRESERFVYVEPDAIVHGLKLPRDKYWTKDDYLWGLKKIGSEAAWNCTTGDPKIVVAVVDGGLDPSHSDLENNLWTVPNNPATLEVEVAGISRTCLAGDWGWDAIKRNTCKPVVSLHGTHLAGTIGAEEGKKGVVGVNWHTRLMSVRFLEQDQGSIDNAVAAAEFVLKTKRKTAQEKDVWVANLSWGTYTRATALFDMLDLLGKANIVMAAGAGNDGNDDDATPFYPASYAVDIPQLISVAATRPDELLPKYSNFGLKSIEIAAPGDLIGSAIPANGLPMKLRGTSMATAHVSGAAALVAAGCPGLNAAEIKTRLLKSVDPIPPTAGKPIKGGRLNVATALKGCACGKQ